MAIRKANIVLVLLCHQDPIISMHLAQQPLENASTDATNNLVAEARDGRDACIQYKGILKNSPRARARPPTTNDNDNNKRHDHEINNENNTSNQHNDDNKDRRAHNNEGDSHSDDENNKKDNEDNTNVNEGRDGPTGGRQQIHDNNRNSNTSANRTRYNFYPN